MRTLIVTTPKGQYSISLMEVAKHRADHYACDVDGYEKDSEEYNDEVMLCMTDSVEAKDWLMNNSDWEDWESKMQKINDDVITTDENFWFDSKNFTIIDTAAYRLMINSTYGLPK